MKRLTPALLLSTMSMAVLLCNAAVAEPLNYVDSSALEPAVLLPAPPAPDSEETKAELDLIVRIQESRTQAQVERVRAGTRIGMDSFRPAMGAWFDASSLPLTSQLLKKLEKDSKYFSEAGKNAFGRRRPRFADNRVKVAIEGQDEACYPSGHSTRGMMMALVLAELVPEQKSAIMTRGWEIGWDRVVAGVHYPSDVVAGRVLGKAIANAARKSAAFKQDFDAAKAEIEKVRKNVANR